MKKFELKNLAELFGSRMPIARIKDRDARIAVVRIYTSLAPAYKAVMNEIESVRVALVGERQEEVSKYGALVASSMDARLTEEERDQARRDAEAMGECARIDKDFQEAVAGILNEDIQVDVKKISLETLYLALGDCGILGDAPIAAVAHEFAAVIES